MAVRGVSLFSELIVSRPRRTVCISSRVRGLALALWVHAAIAAALLLAPLVVLDIVSPIGARPTESTRIFQPHLPSGSRGGDNIPVALIRRGGGATTPSENAQSQQARPRRDFRQPEALPPPSTDSSSESDSDFSEAPAVAPTVGSSPGPGIPEGTGSRDTGSLRGCEGCAGAGLVGPLLESESPPAPFHPADPRLTQPTIIPSSRALPRYPDLARRAGVDGTVILMIVIGSDGRVGAIDVLRSPDERFGFDLAAIEAVKQWRYQPALMGGRPVAVYAQVMVEFTISR